MPVSKNNNISSSVIKNIEPCVYEVSLPREKLFLVGTAHVSKQSTELVEKIILEKKPSVVYVELDEQRKKSLFEKQFKEINVIDILKSKKTGFFIAYLILTIFQKKIAEKTGSSPGEEFKKAITLAESMEAKAVLVDREANTTIKRLWRMMTLWEQVKFIFSLVFGGGEEVEGDEVEMIEKLKESDALTKMINQVGKQFPTIKEIMIDERDCYMSEKIILSNNENNNTDLKKKPRISVGVVGAGHLQGMLKFFDEYINSVGNTVKPDSGASLKSREDVITSLEQIPAVHKFWHYFPWGLTVILASLFVVGFLMTDLNQFKDAIVYWVLANGIFSALGGVLALANPITVLVCFIAAPITSLNPMIGAGMVTGFVQAWLRPPQIKDFEGFSRDILLLKRWWKNRITKVLLVFILSSLGSAVGTWVGVSLVLRAFS